MILAMRTVVRKVLLHRKDTSIYDRQRGLQLAEILGSCYHLSLVLASNTVDASAAFSLSNLA